MALVPLVWLLLPIYGFVSHQYEVARTPWGWIELPSSPMPYDERSQLSPEINSKLRRILEVRRFENGAPSLSAAFAVDGKVVWAGAVGLQDVEARRAVTVDTIYRIGSTSKPMGITGLAVLVDMEKIELDQPLKIYMPNLPNPTWGEVTSRQLASHTAGMAEYADNTDWAGFYRSLALQSRYDDVADSLDVFDESKMLHAAGTQFHYSGYDNILLSVLVQNQSKLPYGDFMSKSVFEPLDMASTGPTYLAQGLDVAESYQVKGELVKPWRDVDLSHKIAAGGFSSTPTDLVRLGSGWLNPDFILPATREVFWTVMEINGSANEQNYALGWRRAKWNVPGVGEIEHINHGGVSKGAQCWLMIVPEYNAVLAITSNRRTEIFFDFADVYVDLLSVLLDEAN